MVWRRLAIDGRGKSSDLVNQDVWGHMKLERLFLLGPV